MSTARYEADLFPANIRTPIVEAGALPCVDCSGQGGVIGFGGGDETCQTCVGSGAQPCNSCGEPADCLTVAGKPDCKLCVEARADYKREEAARAGGAA